MQPVGNTIQPPNAGQALSNLSSIYDIQRQRIGVQQAQQALQTGQYQQQTAQAGAQQDQEKMRERQILQRQIQARAFGDPEDDGYAGKVADWARGNLPLIGNEVAQSALTTQSNKISLRSSVADLSQKYRTILGNTASGFYGQNVSADQVNKAFDEVARENPSVAATVNWAKTLTKHLDDVQDPAQKTNQLQRLVGELTGKPQITPAERQTAAGTIQGSVGPTGAFTAAPGSRIPVAPGQTGPSPTPGQPANFIPAGIAPTETPQFRASVASATGRATGVASTDIDRQNEISKSIKPSMAAIGLTEQIDGLADIVHSGKVAGKFSAVAAALGIKDATSARQLLIKDLGQLKTQASEFAPSNDARTTILSGYPNEDTDTSVIHAAMDYIRGSFKQNLARGNLLQEFRKRDPNLSGLAGADDALTSRFDPRMTEFMSLKTPEDRKAFYKRNFTKPEEAQAFRDKVYGAGP